MKINHYDVWIKIGLNILHYRKEQRLTQAQLAEQLELSNNYISGIECGKAVPSLETFVMICNALDVTADMLLTDTVYRSNEYLKESIATKIDKCSKRNMRIIERFIDLLLEENE